MFALVGATKGGTGSPAGATTSISPLSKFNKVSSSASSTYSSCGPPESHDGIMVSCPAAGKRRIQKSP